MGQKTDFIFDSLYGPNLKDPEEKLIDNEIKEEKTSGKDTNLKADNDLEINGNSYHISLDL